MEAQTLDTTASSTPAPAAEARAESDYVVLMLHDTGTDETPRLWAELGVFPGPRRKALLTAAEGKVENATLVAVPARSWQPQKIEAESKPRYRIVS